MSQRNIDFGTFPDDPSADPIRSAFQKTQENFSELFRNQVTTGVSSVNKTPGAGVTVNKPTGDVIISANIACVKVFSTGLALSILGESTPTSFVTLTQSSSQTLSIEFPANIETLTTGVTNISLSGNITSANITTGLLSASGNIQGGNLRTANTLSVGGNANVGNLGVTGLITAAGNITANGANISNTLYVDSTSSNVGIGTPSPITKLHISDGNTTINSALYTSDLQTISAQGIAPGFNIISAANVAANSRGVFKATRARGTLSAPAVPLKNDQTFSLLGAIYDGSATSPATAGITFEVDGNVTLNNAPQRIVFSTGTGNIRSEKVRIDANGNVGIANTAPEHKLSVTGTMYVSNSANVGNLVTGGILSVGGNANVGNLGTTGLITATGNIIGNYILGNGALLTGVVTSASSITNGTSNISIPSSGGNVTTSVGGNANILVVTGTGANVNGTLNVTGNANTGNIGATNGIFDTAISVGGTSGGSITGANLVSANYFSGNGYLLTGIVATNISGNIANATFANVANVSLYSNTIVRTTGTYYLTFVTGSTTGNYQLGANSAFAVNAATGSLNAVTFTGNLSGTGNSNVGNLGATGLITATGNIQAGNLISAGLISAIGNITASGNLIVSNQANISGNLGVNSVFAVNLSATGNIQASQNLSIIGNANIGNLSTSGNITASYFFGNGSQLTGLAAGTANTAQTVTNAAQPNITSVGTLTSLTVSGNILSTSSVSNAAQTIYANNGNTGTGAFAGVGAFNDAGSSLRIISFGSNYSVQAGQANLSGLVAPTATPIVFWQNAIERMRIDSTGALSVVGNANVGNLLVNGTLSAIGRAQVSNSISATSSANTALTIYANSYSAGTGAFAAVGAFNDLDASLRLISFGSNYANFPNLTGLYSSANTPIVFWQNGDERMRIDSAGALSLVGNASVGNLSTSGLITASGNITGNYFIGNGSLLTGVSAGTATTAQTVTNNAQPNITSVGTLTSLTVSNRVNATGLSTSYGVTTGNSVGALNAIMGNSSSATWLLSGTSDGVFRGGIQLLDSGGVMRLYEGANFMAFGGNALSISGTATAGNITTTGTVSCGQGAILGGGVLSLGTGVLGSGTGGAIRITGTSNTTYIQSGIYLTANSSANLVFTTMLNGREWMRLDTNGNLGVNTNAPTSTLHVVGTANITGALTLGSTLTTTGNVNSGNIDANIISATSLSVDSFITFSSTSAISAAGTNQGTATVLTTIINQVTTVSSGQGVRLPVLGQGYIVYITNDSANNLNVYPASGGAINSLGANNPLIMPAGSTLQFIAGSSSKWYSVGATYA